jgi:phytoene dehydrogenase-like protein
MKESVNDVVIVGAGLAGLRAAALLESNGLSVLLLEKRECVGGRMASHTCDGFILDEGFQLINPSYPELRATGVLADFDLRSFEPSVRLLRGNTSMTVVDPRSSPREAIAFLRSRDIPLVDVARAARLFVHCGLGSAQRIIGQRDTSTKRGLESYGFSSSMIDRVWLPFLRGTLLEEDLNGSWQYTQLLLRSFFKGRPGTHPGGIAALPRTMAARLRTTTLRLGEAVSNVTGTRVQTSEGEYQGRAVILATDSTDANGLVAGERVEWLSQTTWWLALPQGSDRSSLQIDVLTRPFTSALDLTAVAPERAPAGKTLVAVPANGVFDSKELDEAAIEYAARLFDTSTADISLVEKSVVPRALPKLGFPLNLSISQRRGDVVMAGDYLQTPSIQGALVSGRRAAQQVLNLLGV